MKLTNAQATVISLLASSPLREKFYWTGGTVLSYHYLSHRTSLDLDFFSEERFLFEEYFKKGSATYLKKTLD